jgi:hypothetical protein
MAEWRTPLSHRKQLLLETAAVAGEVDQLRLEEMVQVLPFQSGRVLLPDGTVLENLWESGEVKITSAGSSWRPRLSSMSCA